MNKFLEKTVLLCFISFGCLLFVYYNLLSKSQELQFEYLAQSFLQGKLYLGIDNGTWLDASYYKGYAYWPQGLFPAILLTPVVILFNNVIHQNHVQFFLNFLNIFLLYKIALKVTRDRITSVWLSLGYIFASAYIVVGFYSWSWWFAQVVATTALLLALYEYFYRQRWFLIGVYLACALATRIDLIIAATFFFLLILKSKERNTSKIRKLFLLCFPILVGVAAVLLYNTMRFGSPREFGYTYHIPALVTTRNLLKHYGVWNIFYYPTNLYFFFLKGLDGVYIPGTKYLVYPFVRPDIWGMSIFLTSPIFLWCLKTKIRENVVKLAILTSTLILLFLLGYFGVGTRQYGYRYALDFSPFLFIVLCYSFVGGGMSRLTKLVIVVSFLVNLYLFPSIFTSALL